VETIQRWSIARRETFELSLYAVERSVTEDAT